MQSGAKAGSWEFGRVSNPIPAEQLTAIVSRFLSEPHHSISITGGEPLLHAAFLENWLPEVRSLGLKVFLETNGLLPDHLTRVLNLLDYVSMDFKPPTATGVAAEATWDRHHDFLRVASETNVYGKLVVTPTTKDSELDRVVDVIDAVDSSITLILQPLTPFGVESVPVSPARVIELHARAARRLQDVRVIPQTHKIIKVL